MPPVLSCESLSCHRPDWTHGRPSRVRDLSLSLRSGTLTGVYGPDGCGKGLFLNLLGLLETPDSGKLQVVDQDPSRLSPAELCELRNVHFGFLFDTPCLLPSFSVAENVAMPLFRICGGDARMARSRTMEVLEFCGLAEEECSPAGRLPAAAQSRAALARALVHEPEILILISPRDEEGLFPLVRHATSAFGICTLWATANLLPEADESFFLQNGRPVTGLVS